MRPTSMAVSALTLAFTTCSGALYSTASAATKANSPKAIQRSVREALALKSKNRLAAAENRLRKVLKAAPDNVDARSALGWVLISRKHSAAAAHQFKLVVHLAPDSSVGREAKAALHRMASREAGPSSTVVASRGKGGAPHDTQLAAQPAVTAPQASDLPDTAPAELVQLRVQHQRAQKELVEAKRSEEQLSNQLQSYRGQLSALQAANTKLQEQSNRVASSAKPESAPTTKQVAAERARLEEMAALGRKSGDLVHLATALQGLAADAEESGNSSRAVAYYQEAITVQQRLGDGLGSTWSVAHLGKLIVAQGNVDQGEQLLRDALTSFSRTGTGWGIAWTLQALSTVAENRGDMDRATQLAASAQQLRGTLLVSQTGGSEAEGGMKVDGGMPADGSAADGNSAKAGSASAPLPLPQAIAFALRPYGPLRNR